MNLFINSINRKGAMHNERRNALCPRLKTNLNAYHFNHMLDLGVVYFLIAVNGGLGIRLGVVQFLTPVNGGC